ncbi:hypothetical protein PQQ96_41410, partial [Paraburkholderia sediminicola]
TMKKLFRVVALVFTVVLTGCATSPQLLEQTSAERTSVPAKSVLIVINGAVFDNPPFGPGGRVFLDAMGSALQESVSGVPVRVIAIDPMQLENPEAKALNEMHPNYVLRLHTVSLTTRNGIPVNAVWQLDAAEVSTSVTTSEAQGPAQMTSTRFNFRTVYRARAQGRAGPGSVFDSANSAQNCGSAMGKTLGAAVAAAQALGLSAKGSAPSDAPMAVLEHDVDTSMTRYPASNFAALRDVSAIPTRDQHVRELYVAWIDKPYPRAFAVSDSGQANATWGTPKSQAEPPDAAERALKHCRDRGLQGCKLYAVDDRVVYVP